MPAPLQPPYPYTWTDEERQRIFGPDPPESVAYRQQVAEENARRLALVKERARIREIAGMVERVNGWERLDELVDATLEQAPEDSKDG